MSTTAQHFAQPSYAVVFEDPERPNTASLKAMDTVGGKGSFVAPPPTPSTEKQRRKAAVRRADAAPPPATTQLRPSSSSQKVEGVGSPKWDLRHTSAPPRTTSQDDGCTAFCSGSFSTAGGSVLLGQTKDTPSEAGRYRVMRVSTMLLLLLLLLLR